jgi:hypothetical protein
LKNIASLPPAVTTDRASLLPTERMLMQRLTRLPPGRHDRGVCPPQCCADSSLPVEGYGDGGRGATVRPPHSSGATSLSVWLRTH